MDISLAVNKHDSLQKMYDFGDMFILECLIKESNAFWKDVLFVGLMKSIFSLSNIATKFLLFPLWSNSNIKKIANKRVFVNKELKVVQDFFYEFCYFLNFDIFQSTHKLSYVYLHYTSIITAISKTLKKLSIGKIFYKRFLNPNIPSLFLIYLFS